MYSKYLVVPITVSLALFVLSLAGCSSSVENNLPCSDPAPLEGSPSDEVEGFMVVYESDREWTEEEVETTTNELATKHTFEIRDTYSYALQGFSVNDLSTEALDGLRCEQVVKFVEYNAKVEAGPGA